MNDTGHSRLIADDDGSTIVEFALLAPVMVGMMLAVLQIGSSMQSYSALRNVATEVARQALINDQRGTPLSEEDLEAFGEDLATGPAYNLADRVEVEVGDAATQRVAGARELEVTVAYRAPLILPFFDFVSPQLSFSKPIFLIDGGASPGGSSTTSGGSTSSTGGSTSGGTSSTSGGTSTTSTTTSSTSSSGGNGNGNGNDNGNGNGNGNNGNGNGNNGNGNGKNKNK